MEDLTFYRQEETRNFTNSLDVDEKAIFDLFVSVRNGEMTPVEAFTRAQQYVEELEASVV